MGPEERSPYPVDAVFMFPRPVGQTFEDSLHPYRKKTYKQVHKKSNEIDDVIRKETGRLLVIRECELIHLFDKPITQLLNFLQLPLKTGFLKGQDFQSLPM